MNKTQTMVLFDASDRDRVDRLRIVLGISRAEVIRRAAMTNAVPAMERKGTTAARIARLDEVAGRVGVEWPALVRALCAGRQVVPSLEDLEATPRDELQSVLHDKLTSARGA